jgi:hypothetical protein
MLRWCFFLILFIFNWNILPMLNSFLICMYIINYSLYLTSSFCFQRFFHVLGNRHCTSCIPFPIPFIWCNIVSTHKAIKDWTFNFTCCVVVHSLCVPLFPWGSN